MVSKMAQKLHTIHTKMLERIERDLEVDYEELSKMDSYHKREFINVVIRPAEKMVDDLKRIVETEKIMEARKLKESKEFDENSDPEHRDAQMERIY